jgi:hypothetical protein
MMLLSDLEDRSVQVFFLLSAVNKNTVNYFPDSAAKTFDLRSLASPGLPANSQSCIVTGETWPRLMMFLPEEKRCLHQSGRLD